MKDIVEVYFVNGSVLALVHLVDLKEFMSLVLIGLTIAYTIWKWRKESKEKK